MSSNRSHENRLHTSLNQPTISSKAKENRSGIWDFDTPSQFTPQGVAASDLAPILKQTKELLSTSLELDSRRDLINMDTGSAPKRIPINDLTNV